MKTLQPCPGCGSERVKLSSKYEERKKYKEWHQKMN